MKGAKNRTGFALPCPDWSLFPSFLESCLSPRVRELVSQSNLTIKPRSWIEEDVWEVDIQEGCYAREGFLASFDSRLRRLHPLQTALNHWWGLCYTTAELKALLKLTVTLDTIKSAFLEKPFEDIVVILALLSLVYQYLSGNIDDGGAVVYSATSLDFRDIFISTVLFQGSYVWIKFREVAGFKGVVKRKIYDKRGNIKVVFEPRFKPPRENGKKHDWIYITQCATPEEAFDVYQIVAFYYNQAKGQLDLGDGSFFTIPPMSLEEESLTGMQKRAWLPPKVRKVYEDYKHARTNVVQEATLLMDFAQDYRDKEMQESDEWNVDHSETSLLNSTDTLHQHLPLTCQIQDSRMGIAMHDNQGLECTSLAFGGVHEDLAMSNGHSLGFQEGTAIYEASATPNLDIGMDVPDCNQLEMILLLLANQQEIISNLQKLLCDQQKQLQEARIQISRLQGQQCLQQQGQEINQEDLWNEVGSMHQQTYTWPITLADDGTEAQEAFI